MARPKNVPTSSELALEDASKQFDKFDEEIKTMTMDRMNLAPKQEVEPQTKLSQSEIAQTKDVYLKPKRTLGPGVNPKTGEREKFNEKFRDEWNFAKEYVHFIAENYEVIGESIDLWTKPFPGVNCENWEIPTNKPIWAPRYVAEQIKRKSYHRLVMRDTVRTQESTQNTQYYGTMAVDTSVQRLDARPAQQSKKSIFMGATTF